MFFGQSRLTQSKFDRALENNALLLIALDSEQPVGFKFGYVVGGEPTFFSWLGGVLPAYRRNGIAREMLLLQEDHARSLGLKKIYFTTFDRFPAMVALGLSQDYVLDHSLMENGERKYWYTKSLSS